MIYISSVIILNIGNDFNDFSTLRKLSKIVTAQNSFLKIPKLQIALAFVPLVYELHSYKYGHAKLKIKLSIFFESFQISVPKPFRLGAETVSAFFVRF